jgi:signal peptidase II
LKAALPGSQSSCAGHFSGKLINMVEKSCETVAPAASAEHRRIFDAVRIIYALIIVVIFAADQITKHIVQNSIAHDQVITVIPGFFNLIHTENSGIAFSLFAGSSSPWKLVLLVGVSLALLATVVIVGLRGRAMNWQTGVGLALIVGGASSNLIDRIRFGQVVDFLDVYFRSYHWPTFNVADSAIVVGAGLLLLDMLISK